MNVSTCEEGKKYKVLSIGSDDIALKNRLESFGITKDCIIELQNCSPKKSTLAIVVNNSKIAIRDTEAQNIIVQPL